MLPVLAQHFFSEVDEFVDRPHQPMRQLFLLLLLRL